MLRIAVLGATGSLGAAITKKLASNSNFVVTGLSSSGKDKYGFGIKFLAVDGLSTTSLVQVLKDIDVLVNCYNAPEYSAKSWAENFPKNAKAVTSVCRQLGIPLVQIDNIYLYNQSFGAPYSEASLFSNPPSKKGLVKAGIQHTLDSAFRTGLQGCVIRCTSVVGPYAINSHYGKRFFDNMKTKNELEILFESLKPYTFTYTQDLANLVEAVILNQEFSGQTYLAPAMQSANRLELAKEIARVANHPEAKLAILSRSKIRFLSLFVPILKSIWDIRHEYEYEYLVDDSKAKKTFKLESTSWPEAIKQTAAWFAQLKN